MAGAGGPRHRLGAHHLVLHRDLVEVWDQRHRLGVRRDLGVVGVVDRLLVDPLGLSGCSLVDSNYRLL